MSELRRSAAQAPHDVRRCRILAIDDSVDILESLSVVIDVLGHDLMTAIDGETALAVGREFAPNLVLLDVGLPGTSGFEVALLMRAEAWGRRSLLVAVTGWARDKDREPPGGSAFDDYVIKPVDVHLLGTLIARAMGADAAADTPA